MYESPRQAPISHAHFIHRLIAHLLWVAALLAGSLGVAMLLGGMGPVNPPQSFGGKLFAGLFALYAGLVFIVTAALLFTPLLHRLMHHFHWNEKG